MSEQDKTLLWALRDKKGWYIQRSFGGDGSLGGARLYPKIGQARGRITHFAKKGIPLELVELHVVAVRVVDETERKARIKEQQETRAAAREAARAKQELEAAQRALLEAQERVARLQGASPCIGGEIKAG